MPPYPRRWAEALWFDPAAGTVVRQPPGEGKGYWAGAPGVTYDPKLKSFYLVYRLRRPRGVEPDRGAEILIASSRDGIVFEDVWKGTKDQLPTTSIERSALIREPEGPWRLYVSFVDPADGRWMIGLAEAEQPDAFDLGSARPVLTAAGTGTEGVKDPFLFRVGGLGQMIVSYARADAEAPAEAMHGTHDAYNTGLVKSATGLATSANGVDWTWQGEVFGPSREGWDQYAARIGTVWYQPPVWMAYYDGSADVSENYEERCGVAYSPDLRTFHRATTQGPLFANPNASGAVRYFDLLPMEEATYVYYEFARQDGSHDLRVFRAPPVVCE